MSFQTFSRSYLQVLAFQGLESLHKQQYIDALVQRFIAILQNDAAAGKTSYTYEPPHYLQQINGITITIDDLISAFQRKFPDCDVSYKEVWIDVNSTTKSLRKGVVIDWS